MEGSPLRALGRVWTVTRISIGGLVLVLGVAVLLSSVETDETPERPCGGMALTMAFGGSMRPGAPADLCRVAAGEQAGGAAIFIVVGGVLLVERRVRRRFGWTADGHPLALPPPPGSPSNGIPPPPPAPAALPGTRRRLLTAAPVGAPRLHAPPVVSDLRHVQVIFGCFVAAVLLLGVAILSLDLSAVGAGLPVGAAIAIVVGASAVVAVLRAVAEPPLHTTGSADLAASWRTRFFLRLAFAMVPALLGLAGAFLSGSGAPDAVGTIASLVLLVPVAPTARAVRRDEAELGTGGGLSLSAALREASDRTPST